MTREQSLDRIALPVIIAGLIVGAVSFWVKGPIFWVVCGVSALLEVTGIILASWSLREQRKRERQGR